MKYIYFKFTPFRIPLVESYEDKLKTILATYIFRDQVARYKQDGVDFSKHYYVPETDVVTGQTHYDVADHNHVLKRIASKFHF